MRRAKLSLHPCCFISNLEHLTRKLSGFCASPVTCASSDPKEPHLRAVVSRTDGTAERRNFTPGAPWTEVPVSRAGTHVPR
jgi:hypothetical protein